MTHCFVDEDGMQWLKGTLPELYLKRIVFWKPRMNLFYINPRMMLRKLSESSSKKTVPMDNEIGKA